MATTPNYGWVTPAPTDLVTDLPADFEVFADAVDADLAGLLGGTTGQVLTKDSNTDHDFSWQAAPAGILATIFDAKGDLIAASAADTADRLAVGANGTVLTAASGETTGLKWEAPNGMIELATGSLSGATTTISSIPTTYRDLRLIIRNYLPANDGASLAVRINGLTSGHYDSGAGTSNQPLNLASTDISGQQDNEVTQSLIVTEFFDYANTSTWRFFRTTSITNNQTTSANLNLQTKWGANSTTSAITSLVFRASTGNMTSGTYILYGVK